MKVSIDEVRKRLQQPLPGEEAHMAISPSGRLRSSEAFKRAKTFYESAVGMTLYEDKGQLNAILMQRPTYKGAHSGQVCFPGGKREDFEHYLYQTAIRETQEEIGLDPSHFKLLGELTPVFIPISKHQVQPYIFYYDRPPLFIPDQREVEEIFSFPVEEILKDNLIKKTQIIVDHDLIFDDVPYFEINNKVVWGATAMIINEFRWLFDELY